MTNPSEMPEMSPQEHKPTAWKGGVFLLVVLTIAALLAFFVLQQRSVEGPLVVTEKPAPLRVETVSVRIQDAFTVDEKFTGLTVAGRTSQLGFSSGGRVDELRADVGTKVEKGDRLAALDTRALRAQLQSARAMVKEAEAAHTLALATVERQVTLAAQGHVSQQRVDEAVAQSDSAKARIDAAKANADLLRVQIDLASIDAPFAGTITKRFLDEGAIASPGQPIFELVESGALEARIGLPVSLAETLVEGNEYTLTSDGYELPARLRAKTGIIDTGNRSVMTVFDLEGSASLSPGTVIRLALKQTLEEQGFWIPLTALTERERGLWSIYVARKDGSEWRAEPDTIEVIHTEGEQVYARGAVREGDLVIRGGLQRLTPGQLVTPDKPSSQSASTAPSGG